MSLVFEKFINYFLNFGYFKVFNVNIVSLLFLKFLWFIIIVIYEGYSNLRFVFWFYLYNIEFLIFIWVCNNYLDIVLFLNIDYNIIIVLFLLNNYFDGVII